MVPESHCQQFGKQFENGLIVANILDKSLSGTLHFSPLQLVLCHPFSIYHSHQKTDLLVSL